MAEGELLNREQRRPNAGLRPPDSFSSRRWAPLTSRLSPAINKALILELMGGDNLETQDNVLFMGNLGAGKPPLPQRVRSR